MRGYGVNRDYIIPFYRRFNVSFTRGSGVCLYDSAGKRYLDFASGVATSSLGHCHPAMVEALRRQVGKLWHVSNLYNIAEAERLAEELVRVSFADMAFFVNSGAEAVECGFKIARSYQNGIGRSERYKMLTLRRSFHGRTYAACSASEPTMFTPLLYPYVDWFVSVSPSIDAIREEIEKGIIGAVLVEPVQAEGGVHILSKELLEDLRALCDQHDVLLFFDCVQCGFGRTGKFFAYEHFGVTPDICAIAKGMGGGFPVGGCLVTHKAGKFVTARMHGSTYGGNPLAAVAALTVLSEIQKPGFLDSVTHNGNHLLSGLRNLSKKHKIIREVRGLGLLIGLEVDGNVYEITAKLIDMGVLVAPIGAGSVIRVVPPLVVTRDEIDEALNVFDRLFSTL